MLNSRNEMEKKITTMKDDHLESREENRKKTITMEINIFSTLTREISLVESCSWKLGSCGVSKSLRSMFYSILFPLNRISTTFFFVPFELNHRCCRRQKVRLKYETCWFWSYKSKLKWSYRKKGIRTTTTTTYHRWESFEFSFFALLNLFS